jgi:hypothetical protein
MALGITKDCGNYAGFYTPQCYGGQLKILTGSIAFDDSYPTGGESMDISDMFNSLNIVLFESKAGYVFEYDYGNKKVKVMMGNNDGAADGPMVEVANETNLSALTAVKFLAVGY